MQVDEYMTQLTHEERQEHIASLTPGELLQLGIDLYNAAHYWHAHEAWEAAWLEAPDELRLFYQGLIQVTAAFVHVKRNEYPGSVSLLAAGIAKLDRYPTPMLGIDLEQLLEGARAARARLIALGERRLPDFDQALIPPITLA
jgi:predicted metal-dependent hydrolase